MRFPLLSNTPLVLLILLGLFAQLLGLLAQLFELLFQLLGLLFQLFGLLAQFCAIATPEASIKPKVIVIFFIALLHWLCGRGWFESYIQQFDQL